MPGSRVRFSPCIIAQAQSFTQIHRRQDALNLSDFNDCAGLGGCASWEKWVRRSQHFLGIKQGCRLTADWLK
jgi:hypothetical protein